MIVFKVLVIQKKLYMPSTQPIPSTIDEILIYLGSGKSFLLNCIYTNKLENQSKTLLQNYDFKNMKFAQSIIIWKFQK